MLPMKKLDTGFYNRADVVKIARELIGKVLVTHFDGTLTYGRIVETEAYAGAIDRASHAFGNRRTNRTEVMFKTGGTAYVYLIYGIHHLFNVVTNKQDVPHAVLIRAIDPNTWHSYHAGKNRQKSGRLYPHQRPGQCIKSPGYLYKTYRLEFIGR